MFLLHWSIELYLKAFLLSNTNFEKGHKLVRLYNLCRKIDPQMELIIMPDIRKTGECAPSFWVKYIDVFGAEYGGVRYFNKKTTSYVYPSNIYETLTPLITYIKENVNGDTDITNYC